jgi:hypothetical protein
VTPNNTIKVVQYYYGSTVRSSSAASTIITAVVHSSSTTSTIIIAVRCTVAVPLVLLLLRQYCYYGSSTVHSGNLTVQQKISCDDRWVVIGWITFIRVLNVNRIRNNSIVIIQ